MPDGLSRSADRGGLSRSSSRAPLEEETEEEDDEEEETETELTEEDDDDVVVDPRPPPQASRQTSKTGKRPRSSLSKSRNSARSQKVEQEPTTATIVPMTTMDETRGRSRDSEREPPRRSDPPPYSSDPQRRARQGDRGSRTTKPWWKTCCGIFFIVCAVLLVLLLLILIPLGYNELEYYEMGFHRNKATGFVDTGTVYQGGRHWVGVNSDFVKYPSTMQRECFTDISIFNHEKKKITFSLCFSYKVRSEDLKLLHETYGTNFQPLVRNAAALAVKHAAVKISLETYRIRRPDVAIELEKAVADGIGGTCCLSTEQRQSQKYKSRACEPDTLKCTKGFYVALTHLNLHRIDFSDPETEQFMKRVSEREIEDTRRFEQEEKMARMRTEQLELEHNFLAREIAQNASAESSRIKVAAMSEAESVVEYWRNQGLRLIYDSLNVTQEEYKKSLDYVITLRNQNKANLYMGFRYMVAEANEPDKG